MVVLDLAPGGLPKNVGHAAVALSMGEDGALAASASSRAAIDSANGMAQWTIPKPPSLCVFGRSNRRPNTTSGHLWPWLISYIGGRIVRAVGSNQGPVTRILGR